MSEDCNDWLRLYNQAWFIQSVLVPGLIATIASSSKFMLRFLSRFECEIMQSEETLSQVKKMVALQAFVAGVLLNFESIDLELYGGFTKSSTAHFSEFSSGWYSEIGTQIITTVILMAITPHISNGGFHFLTFLKRIYDQKWNLDPKKTRQKLQHKYEQKHLGNEFLSEYRFANLLTLLFIAFLYSSTIPLLYPVAILVIGVAYWIDKWFIFNFYRRPYNYNGQLTLESVNIAFFAVPLHFLGTFLMLQNSAIIPDNSFELNQKAELLTSNGFTAKECFKQLHTKILTGISVCLICGFLVVAILI